MLLKLKSVGFSIKQKIKNKKYSNGIACKYNDRPLVYWNKHTKKSETQYITIITNKSSCFLLNTVQLWPKVLAVT